MNNNLWNWGLQCSNFISHDALHERVTGVLHPKLQQVAPAALHSTLILSLLLLLRLRYWSVWTVDYYWRSVNQFIDQFVVCFLRRRTRESNLWLCLQRNKAALRKQVWHHSPHLSVSSQADQLYWWTRKHWYLIYLINVKYKRIIVLIQIILNKYLIKFKLLINNDSD